jgi:hypothetical protein
MTAENLEIVDDKEQLAVNGWSHPK